MKRTIGCVLVLALLLLTSSAPAQSLQLLDTLQLPWAAPSTGYNLFGRDSVLFVPLGNAGLWLVNITDPANLARLSQIDTLDVHQGVVPVFTSHHAYLQRAKSVTVLDFLSPTVPGVLGSIWRFPAVSGASLDDIIAGETYLFSRSRHLGYDSLLVLNPADPAHLSLMATHPDPAGCAIAADQQYIFRISQIGVLEILEQRDGSPPVHVSQCSVVPCAWALSVRDGFAYIGADGYFQIIDVHDVLNPVPLSSTLTGTVYALGRIGESVVVGLNNALQVFDLSDATNPRPTLNYPLADQPGGLWTRDSTIFVAVGGVLSALQFIMPPPTDFCLTAPADSDTCAVWQNDVCFVWYRSYNPAVSPPPSYRLHLQRGADAVVFPVGDTVRTVNLTTLAWGDLNGATITWSVEAATAAGVTECDEPFTLFLTDTGSTVTALLPVPVAFGLEDACPNPFNATTTLAYSLAQPGYVTLIVYDLQGREVATLVAEDQPTGAHHVQWDAAAAPSGAYFVRLQSGADMHTQKLLLLK